MQYLYLDSNNALNQKFTLDEPISGTYKLELFTSTNNIYNINDTNNKIYFNENGSNLTGTLTNGFYLANDFKDHLTTTLNNTATGTITITLNENTNKLTITNTLLFYFTFGTNTNNSAYKLMGFNALDGTNATTQTSDNAIDLNSYKCIFMDIDQNNSKNIFGTEYFNTSFCITSDCSFGEKLTYINQDYYDQYINLNNTKQINYTFHDNKYNELNLNSEFELILKKC